MLSKSILYLVAGLILLCSCKPHNEQNENSAGNLILNDSIRRLDTLVLRYRTSDPELALKLAKKGINLSNKINSDEARILGNMMLGNAYSLTQMDSSFYYYNEGLRIADSSNQTLYNKLHYNIAMLQDEAGNRKNALSMLDSSLANSIQNKDYRIVSDICNSIGNILFDLRDTIGAKKMYDSSYNVAERINAYVAMGAALGNKVKFVEDNDSIVRILKKAASLVQRDGMAKEALATLFSNLANHYGDPDTAIFYYKKALTCITPQSAPTVVEMIYNNMACTFLEKGEVIIAENLLLEKAIPLAKKNKDYEWLWVIYESYSEVLEVKGNKDQSIKYERMALKVMQMADAENADKQIRLLAAMLDLKKKEAVILKSSIDLRNTNETLNKLNLIIVGLILFFLILISLFYFRYQRKKIIFQNQLIISAKKVISAEEIEKAKISREFHDLTGFMFADLHDLVKNTTIPDISIKEKVLVDLNNIRQTVREISHRMSPQWLTSFPLEKNIEALCLDCKKSGSLIPTFIVKSAIPRLAEDIKLHLFRIVQELLTNAIKYAPKSNVKIIIESEEDFLKLIYLDDGPGFDQDLSVRNGIGINNINERISLLNGKIKMISKPNAGTVYEIHIPL